MARKEKRNVRFDNRHVRLRTGETQKKNGYEYRWTTPDGKRHSIFATTLDSLRDMEAELAVYNLCNFNVAISIILIVEFMINVVIGLKLFHNQSI